MKEGGIVRSGDRNWILFGLILWGCLTVSAQTQPLISQPDTLAGPWEVAGPSSVDGIFLMISASQATQQSIQVRVYHRKPGRGSAGWYVLNQYENTGTASFDGTNLRLLGLTAMFDPAAAHWTGEWVLDGETRKVVLERPHPLTGSTPNPLCGDWGKVSDTTQPPGSPTTSVVIHILQSWDGAFTAWMDTESVIIPQRYESRTFGRSMTVEAADPRNVVLQNEAAIYQKVRNRFTGALSEDGNSLTGTWNGRAAESFRRIRER
jgi:hypothetical protein